MCSFRWFPFLLLALLSVRVLAAPSPAVPLDRVLVIVNDDVVTQSELDDRLPVIKRQLTEQHLRVPPDQVLRRQVLERMILERLQLQLAAQLGIKATDAQVNGALQNLAERNHLTPAQFDAALRKEGIPAATFRHQLQTQIIIQQLLEREINDRVSVSENEVQAFLAQQRDKGDGKQYNVSHILIAIPDAAKPEAIQAAQARAEEALRKLRTGANFEQTAIADSQDPDALEGGNLGWKSAGQLPELFVSALENMKPGDISGLLRGPNGFHILRLNDVRGATEASVMQTHARHILIKTNEIVNLADAENKIRQLRERIENGADFAALAKANSDDPGSALAGGDLGWINPGQMVPGFEKAMNALKVDELSQPVRTRFGVHLIQVLGRRQADISEERREINARQQIHARKADERYEQWLRQLRDEAYVKYVGEGAPPG